MNKPSESYDRQCMVVRCYLGWKPQVIANHVETQEHGKGYRKVRRMPANKRAAAIQACKPSPGDSGRPERPRITSSNEDRWWPKAVNKICMSRISKFDTALCMWRASMRPRWTPSYLLNGNPWGDLSGKKGHLSLGISASLWTLHAGRFPANFRKQIPQEPISRQACRLEHGSPGRRALHTQGCFNGCADATCSRWSLNWTSLSHLCCLASLAFTRRKADRRTSQTVPIAADERGAVGPAVG